MHLDSLQTEYLLRPMRVQDGHTEIYSVDSVTLAPPGHQTYVPFTSFRHREECCAMMRRNIITIRGKVRSFRAARHLADARRRGV